MCKFCDNVLDYIDLEKNNPYLVEEKALPFGEERTIYRVIVPVEIRGELSQYFGVDDIAYCPYCGAKIGRDNGERD